MGETRVDLQHLLEDIRDAYPGSLEETIITEIVANSLDSGATTLWFDAEAAASTLTVVDDGSGMLRRELRRYHDIASSTKSRGEGIGFAGVGIKLGLLAAEEVLTESRRGQSHVASSWRLANRHRAPWKWVDPIGLVSDHGTAVRLTLHNPLSPLLDAGFLESTLLHHFQPLVDPVFDELLAVHYPGGVRFRVCGREVERRPVAAGRALLSIRLGRKRKPSAAGYIVRADAPLPEDAQGLAVSTLGKVIKRGWDWLGFAPSEPDRVTGLMEVPALAESLTLNKADFVRTGPRGALYLACRKAVQEAVSAQLAAWGETRETADEQARRRKARPVERDLTSVLAEMAEHFPLIASLVETRAGGQARLPIGTPIRQAEAAGLHPSVGLLSAGDVADRTTPFVAAPGPDEPTPLPTTPQGEEATAPLPPAPEPDTPPADAHVDWPGPKRRRRPARLGLTIEFESRPEDANLGRLVESTVWVNDVHPAYRRAAASRAEGYHLALTVAMVLAPLAVEPADTQSFLTSFLARWGEAIDSPPERRTRRRRRISSAKGSNAP